jgi:hypothetical protein
MGAGSDEGEAAGDASTKATDRGTNPPTVIPAKAGISLLQTLKGREIPAFAGMTEI